MPSIQYSLIICTYNQAESLQKVLEGLAAQSRAQDVELLVIDNNSSDDTKKVCESLFKRLPFRCRYIFEARQGLSVARNRGVNEAIGNVLIFTDDDARLPEDWLQNYALAYEKYAPDCVFGRIVVDWDKGQPDWYSHYFAPMFVALDYGSRPLQIADQHHEFYGKNFSVRKSILEQLGGFDEKLGRIGGRLFLGEETRIYRGLVSMGCKVIYEPSLYVGHMLKDHEYTVEHCLKHVHDATISEYYMMASGDGRKLLGRPLYTLKKALSLLHLALRTRLESKADDNPPVAFYSKVMVGKALQLLMLWVRGIDAIR